MRSKPRLLIVEDDENAREALAELLRDEGFAILQAIDIAAARALLAEHPVELMLLDLKLPDGDAQTLLDDLAVRRRLPATIAMTAFGSGSRAIKAMRAGIEDYVQKPIDFDFLLETIRRITARRTTFSDDIIVRPGAENVEDAIVGASLAMQHVYKLIGRVAQTEARVLIVGESGTGKELVAKEIHRYSARARGPFVAFNCAAVPETLLESELFGFEKGAFTGAHATRIGRFEAANNGTLFLDEVSDLALATQTKLLRALQERSIERLGSNAVTPVNVRIISASNRHPRDGVRAGTFREDLFYRLSVVEVPIPPLRERGEDIEALTVALLRRIATAEGRQLAISPAALGEVRRRPWPGNVRELENALERAVALSGGRIDAEHVRDESCADAE